MRERESNVIIKNCIFFTLFYTPWNRQSVPLSKQKKLKTGRETHRPHSRKTAEIHASTHTYTRTPKPFILSKEEEERERYDAFHYRAFFSFKTQSVSLNLFYTTLFIQKSERCSHDFLIKNPPRRTGDTYAKRIDTYTHI